MTLVDLEFLVILVNQASFLLVILVSLAVLEIPVNLVILANFHLAILVIQVVLEILEIPENLANFHLVILEFPVVLVTLENLAKCLLVVPVDLGIREIPVIQEFLGNLDFQESQVTLVPLDFLVIRAILVKVDSVNRDFLQTLGIQVVQAKFLLVIPENRVILGNLVSVPLKISVEIHSLRSLNSLTIFDVGSPLVCPRYPTAYPNLRVVRANRAAFRVSQSWFFFRL